MDIARKVERILVEIDFLATSDSVDEELVAKALKHVSGKIKAHLDTLAGDRAARKEERMQRSEEEAERKLAAKLASQGG